jgi:hypothetical protein
MAISLIGGFYLLRHTGGSKLLTRLLPLYPSGYASGHDGKTEAA